MKFIQITEKHGLTEDVHKQIKQEAVKAGMMIPEYLLRHFIDKPEHRFSEGALEPSPKAPRMTKAEFERLTQCLDT